MEIKIPKIKSLVTLFILSAILTIYLTSSVFSAETATGTVPLNFTVAQLLSVTKSTEMTTGILFGSISPDNTFHAARNNTAGAGGGTQYNWTIDTSSTSNAAFYNKLSAAITCTGGTCTFQVSGSSTSGTAGFSTNSTFSETAYTAIGNCNNIDKNGGNCWTRYFLNVSIGVASGDYGTATSYAYCANATSGSTACS